MCVITDYSMFCASVTRAAAAEGRESLTWIVFDLASSIRTCGSVYLIKVLNWTANQKSVQNDHWIVMIIIAIICYKI